MSVSTALYNLLIGPLELIFEVIFAIANRVAGHPGLAIVILSLTMNFLVLPLYKRADAMQAEERDTEQRLSRWVTHIKKTFSGDERFMILQTYYRQNGYRPSYALKGSLSLLLEVPFFIAAYNLLSGLELLRGVSFGPIRDLGAADGMLTLAGLQINVLPILMTVINLISGVIYTRGMPLRSKIQLYGMAGIFLVLLYDSPAGLVFYWTLNNVFSLVKNIFYRLKNPRRVLGILASVAGLAVLAAVLIHPLDRPRKQMGVILLAVCLQLPLILSFFRAAPLRTQGAVTGKEKATFFISCAFLTLLTGLLIPSAVIQDSPAEFVSLYARQPLLYVLNAFLLAAGLFLVWLGIFYMLANDTGKHIMGYVAAVACVMAAVNYLFFGKGYGNLSPSLKFDMDVKIPLSDQLMNAGLVLLLAAALWFLWKKKQELLRMACLAAVLAVSVMAVINMADIHSVTAQTLESLQLSSDQEATIPLSRRGKNVVVLMMDRAVSSHLPYVFQEKPELREQFAGFTYYPNTMSFGQCTNMGLPALYGGYEYTPEEMNRRDQEPLVEKHNEALKVMPVMFSREDYRVTVCDPSYANYGWVPDLSIYDEYPEIDTYLTMGRFNLDAQWIAESTRQLLNRNFFCYSLFKIAPLAIQPTLYCAGTYNEPDLRVEGSEQKQEGLYQASGLREHFMESYAVLNSLPRMTRILEEERNTFFMMSNDTTHEPQMLQLPDYTPQLRVDNTAFMKDKHYVLDGREMKMENTNQIMHFHVNAASLLQLGHWMDYLRQQGVYDNTRIIIVGDHGRSLKQFDDMRFGKTSGEDVMIYNPLLLVKDFGSTAFTVDQRFMTNADVATLASRELIEHPVNPFTGMSIDSHQKEAPEQHILFSLEWNVTKNNGNTFLPGDWYAVHDNIFDLDNWKKIG